jgi:tripartite-type tricarboxylate transporter receptor subunit TctC
MLGGRVQMNIGTISTLAQLVRVRVLAITGATRNDELPERPWRKAGCPRWRPWPTTACSAPTEYRRRR